jgi:uncharacterized membrane protein YhiD involved in acid resistance
MAPVLRSASAGPVLTSKILQLHHVDITGPILLRIIFAAFLGVVVGLERAVHHKPAGLRANMFICVGAAILTLLSDEPAAISCILIALSFVNMYYVSPRIRTKQCSAVDPSACDETTKLSRILLWVSAVIYGVGVFVAYVLGPILARLDSA